MFAWVINGCSIIVQADILVNSVAKDDADLTATGAIGAAFSKAGGAQFTQVWITFIWRAINSWLVYFFKNINWRKF